MPFGSISSFFHSAWRFSGASASVRFGLFGPREFGHQAVGKFVRDSQVVLLSSVTP